MVYCPGCNAEWEPNTVECPICGKELAESLERFEWIIMGEIEDKLSADFAREALIAYEIPAVIMSRSGYFGTIGLTLRSFYTGQKALFEVRVPATYLEEAAEILNMTLGNKWHRKDA